MLRFVFLPNHYPACRKLCIPSVEMRESSSLCILAYKSYTISIPPFPTLPRPPTPTLRSSYAPITSHLGTVMFHLRERVQSGQQPLSSATLTPPEFEAPPPSGPLTPSQGSVTPDLEGLPYLMELNAGTPFSAIVVIYSLLYLYSMFFTLI